MVIKECSRFNMNMINLIYVIFWGIISFISSFIDVLDWDFSKIVNGDLLNDIFSPLLIWIIAFFGDYLYTIFALNKKTHILNEFWTKISYVLVELLFVILLLSIHITGNCPRIVCMVAIYMCMMGLKTSSLYALCPRQKVESI